MAQTRAGDGVRRDAETALAGGEWEPAELLRTVVLALVLFGAVGLGAELVLLEHMEDAWQWVPLVVLAAALLTGGALAALPRPATVRAFQAVMATCVLAGVVGVYLHYAGNVEFEREMEPSIGGLHLFWQAMKGATPSLAPGSLAHLGLFGLACTWRHPALRQRASRPGASGAPTSPMETR